MRTIRLGIIGVGGIGQVHAKNVYEGLVEGMTLAAVCDRDPERLKLFPRARGFSEPEALIASGEIDALVVSTPHYTHPTLGLAAFAAGLHLMVEKPLAVHKLEAERLVRAHTRSDLVFGAMLNQRTNPAYQKIKAMVAQGDLGKVQRIHWTVTDWYRPNAYYQQSAWRATWAGEGGGVLLNQAVHQLDLLCWMFGQPKQVRAFCHFGKYHPIEVEDEVTAYLEFSDQATGVFTTSTGEAPGSNRLEIAGDRGRLIYDGNEFQFTRNDVPASEFAKTSKEPFHAPTTQKIPVTATGPGGQHLAIMQNFSRAILHGEPLLAPGAEGLLSVELANALLLSTWMNSTVTLPIDGQLYAAQLEQRIAEAAEKKSRGRSVG